MPPKESNDRYLVISLSARALAGSLSTAGFSVAAIDLYGDQDLCQIPNLDNYQKIPIFDTPNLLHAINKINKKTPCNYLIYGGGIESCPDLLDQLPDAMTLSGNPSDILNVINHPETFFRLLDQLSIPHPETIYHPPATTRGWLIKQPNSFGGAGVSDYNSDQIISSPCYFQRFISGRVCSVVFVANGKEAKVFGYNEIWTESNTSFKFSGAMTWPDFPVNLSHDVDRFLQLLTGHLELVGLCGMDFIIDDQERIQVIEINPRPTATFELHDQNHELIQQHIHVCQSADFLSVRKNRLDDIFARQVYYAEKNLTIDSAIQWPQWTADLPCAGQVIKTNEPVCTIYTHGENSRDTQKLLRERMALIHTMLV